MLSMKTFGPSMLPLLRNGDVVFFKKTRFYAIQANDIITVKKGDIFFTHRVIYKAEKYLVTKGDNNTLSDGKISPKQVYGLVIKVKRKNNYININHIYLYQSSQYLKEIIAISNAFQKDSIPFVFLKGLPYYLYYFKDYPKRLFSDCDILVGENDINQAEKLLCKLGYKPEPTQVYNQFKFLDKNLKEKNYYKFVNKTFPIVIDLHRTVTLSTSKAYSPINILNAAEKRLVDLFFANIKMIRFAGTKIPLLKNEHLILYLAMHLHKENFSLAHNLDFIQKIVKKIPIDWKEVLSLSTKEKVQNFIIPTFYILHRYACINYPYRFFQKNIPRATSYSVNVFTLLYTEQDVFDMRTSSLKRFKKAFTIFLFMDVNIFQKLYSFLNRNLVLHLIHFSLYASKQYTKNISLISFLRGQKSLRSIHSK